MTSPPTRPVRSPARVQRLFAVYAAASLVPVVVLGVVLTLVTASQGNARGLAEARRQAQLVSRTGIAPLLDGHSLTSGLTSREVAALTRGVSAAKNDGSVLRLRLRDLQGRVVYADDGDQGAPDDEALEAAAGETVAVLSRLDADAGGAGPRVAEVYEPLLAAGSGTRIGVLELYLPYGPIAADISRGNRALLVSLSIGLPVLWLTLLAVSLSVTRRLQRQSALNSHQAQHDALTGLPNRAQFSQRAAAALAAASRAAPMAVAVLDVDRFKQVNDTLGPRNGDRLLVVLADRLRSAVRTQDTVARLGGDEFGVVLCELVDDLEAQVILERLRSVLREPLDLDGLPLAVEASTGYAVGPADGGDVDAVLQHADTAMYAAKRDHSGVRRYDPERDQHDASALVLVGRLARAIAGGELVLHYQPKLDVRTGRVLAVEALVRWNHPDRGLLMPDSFLPAAEQTELIDQLTWWVLREALQALPVLDPSGLLAVAVNVSARSLIQPGFAEQVLRVLDETGTSAGRVLLEITETALLADPVRAADTLRCLDAAGIRISIDDFGAGQTSLGYLATLPVTELKIDKGFVLAMATDQRNAAIVRSVVELGHSLGFTVTAEGVETGQALGLLRTARCDTVQGYLFARPMDRDRTRTFLAEARLSTAATLPAGRA